MKESWIVHSNTSLRKSETKRFDLRMSEMWINGLRADINVIGKHDEVVNIVRANRYRQNGGGVKNYILRLHV